VAFAVGRDSEEGAKGGHCRLSRRGGGGNEGREGESPVWFLYQHFPAYIRRENGVKSRSHAGREFVQMPPQSSVGIYTLPPRPYLRSYYKTCRRPRGESPKMTMPLTSALPVPNVPETPSTRPSSQTAGGLKGRKSNPRTTPPSLPQVVDLMNRPQSPGVVNNASDSRTFDRVDIVGTRPYPRIYPQVDFTTLPREVIHQYLVQFDITPMLHPSPISASSPPPPGALLDPQHAQPIKFPSPTAMGTTTADHNAPQQQHQQINPNRQTPQHDNSIFTARHYRSVDDDDDLAGSSHRTATLADIADLDLVLARLAERHFRDESVHELDTLATFLALVKNSANGKGRFISNLMS
jgi:hypothetical protein